MPIAWPRIYRSSDSVHICIASRLMPHWILVFVPISGAYPQHFSTPPHITWARTSHTFLHFITMFSGPGFHNRKNPILSKIRSLLISLTHVDPSKDAYDRITKKIEYWIEYVLRERLMAVDELVEGVSYVAWEDGGSFANVGRFLKDFRDVPHCSEQARFDFVNRLCSYVLRWFAVASVEHHSNAKQWHGYIIASRGAMGFIRAASFVGHLIECGLLSHELVREHLVKPLTDHYCGNTEDIKGYSVRGNAIYQLFIAAGNTLFQGVFEAEDAWVCFETLEVQSKARNIMGYDAARVKV